MIYNDLVLVYNHKYGKRKDSKSIIMLKSLEGKMIEAVRKLWIRIGIAYGSRCPEDGGKYYDAFQETKWHRGKCPNCGKEVKW